MQALVFDEFGPADVLHLAEVGVPHPAPGQVRIAVRTASVNPVDWKIRSGASRAFHAVTFPAITALDAAGVVVAIGDGVTGYAVGDPVFGPTVGGAAAEFAILAEPASKPPAMDWVTAAALPSAAETGYRALSFISVDPGGTLLINGVAGGVGLAAAQFAVARGVRVIGTASPARHQFLTSIGVAPVAYGEGLADRVAAVTDRVDGVVDVAGNGILPELLEFVTGDRSRIVTIADPTAAEYGVFFTTGAEGRFWNALDVAADLWAHGRFVMPVGHVLPIADGAEAHRISESGHVLGKIVLTVAE